MRVRNLWRRDRPRYVLRWLQCRRRQLHRGWHMPTCFRSRDFPSRDEAEGAAERLRKLAIHASVTEDYDTHLVRNVVTAAVVGAPLWFAAWYFGSRLLDALARP